MRGVSSDERFVTRGPGATPRYRGHHVAWRGAPGSYGSHRQDRILIRQLVYRELATPRHRFGQDGGVVTPIVLFPCVALP